MEYSEACSDVWYLLSNLKQEELVKIPKKLLETIRILKKDDYITKIDLSIPLENQELSDATTGLISFIYNNYLGTKEEKVEYERTYKEYMKSIENRENYKFEFKKENKEEILHKDRQLVTRSDVTNIFLRLVNRIKEIFCKNK